MRRAALFVLLCSQIVNLTAWGIQIGGNLRQNHETTAADVAISLPRTIAVCPHHPHGCPKDCMCPKTYITVGGDSDDVEVSGSLHEPAWVTCSGPGPQSLTPSFAVFLPELQETVPVFATSIFILSEGNNSLPDSFREPPQKIPIA
jgi:hypothetical protein